MLHFQWYTFSELTLEQLYAVLSLRAEVFVVEQQCPFQDPDGKDPLALHLLGTEQNQLVAYIRLFPPTPIKNHVVFGRIITAQSIRTKGYGKQLMQEMLVYCQEKFPAMAIKCSAQYRLKYFYENFGFKTEGDIYQEDNVPHISMRKNFK